MTPIAMPTLEALENASEFQPRHIGIDTQDEAHMLSVIGEASRRALIDSIVPRSIARARAMNLPATQPVRVFPVLIDGDDVQVDPDNPLTFDN